jgi:hypothetical protein
MSILSIKFVSMADHSKMNSIPHYGSLKIWQPHLKFKNINKLFISEPMDPFPELFDLPNQTGQSKQKEEGELFLITKEECESLHGDLDQISCPSDTLNANFVFDNFDFHNPQFSEYEIAAFDEFFTLDNNGADMNTHQVGPDSENEIIVKPSIIHHVETESEDESGSEITDGDISITDTDDSLDSYDNMSDESDTLIREDDSEVQRYQTPPSTPQTSCTNCCSVIKELKSLLVVHMAQVKR